ncbi:MAG: toxin-antitoxin system YwqK family antitoxin [Bacteroidia bacterium]
MKKAGLILGFILLTLAGNAQVKQNDKGMYVATDGSLFTGTFVNTENGVKQSEIEIKNGLFTGEAKYYYASGKLMEAGVYDNGQKEGKWLRYNENGVTVGLAIYSAGKKNGTWIVWDDAGKKRFEMHYHMGEKTGVWSNWNETGELVSSKDYTIAN